MLQISGTRVFAICATALFLTCGGSNPSSNSNPPAKQDGPPEMRFLNSNRVTTIGGDTIRYHIRNLSALDSTWDEVITFGEYSIYKLITPSSTPFTVVGEIRPDTGGEWREMRWNDQSIDPDTGGPFTLELSFE
ncbi:MAG: hypothetical protein GF401_13945 [Chitinivibrionales bacterium]|nr:hypothetical protein [Chitinivibrionales bacterium]